MAYNFLGLVNDLANETNDVELTSSNFSSATGVYNTMKNAVNASIRHINQEAFEWPWNHVSYDETLAAGTVRYAYQSDAKSVDMDSFRVQRNDTFGNETQKLKIISYEEYLDKWVDYEYDSSNTGIRDLPKCVFRTPDQEYGVVPPPDEAYTLTYEYYKLPTDLSAYDDVPSIPESFRYVIRSGAIYYLYLFRNDIEASDRTFNMYLEQIKNMRSIYINRYPYVRDTRVPNRHTSGNNVLRVD